ncbi:AraC family transcriptional regulator [Apibacter sp. HY039]|uniref:helix-turn-helix domain-containing protein n=1 Tax=Apibacter sp. HY039 TaxID=2501476 RepID=UPI000FEC1899|nr:AraC family transcriptional regulator [Apibacter sp. HY039]
MNTSETLNYSGVFLSCFYDNDTSCVHATKDHTLVYLYSGKLIIEEYNKETIVGAGECVFIRRNHRVKMRKVFSGKDQYKGISMTFKRNFLLNFFKKIDKKYIPEDIKAPEKNIFRIPTRPDVTSLFQSLTPYFNSSVSPSTEIINLKEQEGLHCLLRTDAVFFPILFDFSNPWKIDILDFLNENYTDDLTMSEIAAYTGRSLATFKRDFAKISKVPPQKWIINKRLETAYEKLQDKNKKVSEIYSEVGFKNLSHFYSAFKKQYGYSPKR